jgi:hypothetical protein
VFSLIDMGWSRRGCAEWLRPKVPHVVGRSACKWCPLRNDHEWAEMKAQDSDDWRSSVNFDRALRTPGHAVNRGMDKSLYLHRSCLPLDVIDFDNLPPQTLEPFTLYDCVGMCGV